MFGKRNLLRDGVAAKAVVIDAAAGGGQVGSAGISKMYWRIRLLVHYDDGSTAETSTRVSDRDVRLPVAGDLLPIRYDPKDRSRVEIDLAAIDTPVRPGASSSPPTDAELRAISDALDAARETAAEKMHAYQQAKAAGDKREAERILDEGKRFNAEQIRLGEELKRLRALRPD